MTCKPVLGVVGDRADAFALPGRTAGVAGRDQVEHETVLEQADAFVVVHRAEERGRQGLARCVAIRVDDAVVAVPALPAELDVTLVGAVDTQPRLDQFLHAGRALFNHTSDNRLVAQARAGGHRVLEVRASVSSCIAVEHRGDPALGPVRAASPSGCPWSRRSPRQMGFSRTAASAALAASDPRADHQHIGKDLRQQRRAERDQVSAFRKRHRRVWGLRSGV